MLPAGLYRCSASKSYELRPPTNWVPRLAAIERAVSRHVAGAPAERLGHREGVQPTQRSLGHGDRRQPAYAFSWLHRYGIPGVDVHPTEVKAAVTGSGRADKAQVGMMVARILKESVIPGPPDAADVALAITDVGGAAATGGLPALAGGLVMIASLGNRPAASGETAIVDVGGVGYRLTGTPWGDGQPPPGRGMSPRHRPGGPGGCLDLYGSPDDDERDLFDQLTSVSGIGPWMAVAAVGSLGVEQLRTAIGASDIATLTRVPGIGKKAPNGSHLNCATRCRPSPFLQDWQRSDAWRGPNRMAVRGARGLVGLGWQTRDAERAVSLVALTSLADSPDPEDIPALLRRALSRLDQYDRPGRPTVSWVPTPSWATEMSRAPFDQRVLPSSSGKTGSGAQLDGAD